MRRRRYRGSGVPAWDVPTSPSVAAISPATGSDAGGDAVVITLNGPTTGCTGAAVGGVSLTGFAIVDGRKVSGTTGAHTAGIVAVSVTNATGTGTLAGAFTYTATVATFHLLTETSLGLLTEASDNLRTE